MIDCQMILINKKNNLKEKRREAVSIETVILSYFYH